MSTWSWLLSPRTGVDQCLRCPYVSRARPAAAGGRAGGEKVVASPRWQGRRVTPMWPAQCAPSFYQAHQPHGTRRSRPLVVRCCCAPGTYRSLADRGPACLRLHTCMASVSVSWPPGTTSSFLKPLISKKNKKFETVTPTTHSLLARLVWLATGADDRS